MRPRGVITRAVLIAFGAVASAKANAAPPAPDATAQARALYVAGTTAAAEGRWVDAEASFSAAYEMSHNPAALYNRAVALRALGRHREARDAFAAILASDVSVDEATRRQAAAYRDEEAQRVGVLEVSGAKACRLRVDGKEVARREGAVASIDADAGDHSIVASCPGASDVTWKGHVGIGQHVAVVLQPMTSVEPTEPRSPVRRSEHDTRATSADPGPWLVIGAGAVAAVVGGALFTIGRIDRAKVENAEPGSRWSDVEGANDRARVFGWLGPAVFAAGAVSIATGFVWLAKRPHHPAGTGARAFVP
jgi:tetratricopeptide (TPR) repeat protein